MKGATRSPAIRRALARAQRMGWTVEFDQFVACGRYPMVLPTLAAGLCDHQRKVIRVGTHGLNKAQIAGVLEHELEHAELGPGVDRASDRPELGLRCGGHWRPLGGITEDSPAAGDSPHPIPDQQLAAA